MHKKTSSNLGFINIFWQKNRSIATFQYAKTDITDICVILNVVYVKMDMLAINKMELVLMVVLLTFSHHNVKVTVTTEFVFSEIPTVSLTYSFMLFVS